SFWILDDITPLRQIDAAVASSDAFLFAPQTAYRVRRNVNTDTPLPPEEPVGKNPPDGAIINYYLKSGASEPVTLEIFDAANKLVRRFSSADRPEPLNEKDYNIPTYWIRPPQTLSAGAGMQRFVWDLRYAPPKALRYDFPISANYMDTPRYPLGPLVMPGRFTVKLTVGKQSFNEKLTVNIDPRVKTPRAGLQQQFDLSFQAYEGLQQTFDAVTQIRKVRGQIKELRARSPQGALADALSSLDQRLAKLDGEGSAESSTPAVPGGIADIRDTNLTKLHVASDFMLNTLQAVDAQPTTQAAAASSELQRSLGTLLSSWAEIKDKDVKTLNEQLRRANLPPLAP
ncbi:MAG TPA: hypothetical protein VF507_08880, partial [Pyrinomonadaceae bacterium]